MRRLFCCMVAVFLVHTAMAKEVPVQIKIELLFIAYPKAEIESRARKERFSSTDLLTLWKEGKGSLLASPCVLTKAGQEATIKTVREYIYPTAFRYVQLPERETNNTANAGKDAISVPAHFDTTDVGVIMQITPQLSPEGDVINLTMQPLHIFEPEWVDYAKGVSSTNKERNAVHFEQPFFFCNSISTSISVLSGQRTLLGGGMETPDKTRYVYAFVGATVLDASGKPVRVPPAEGVQAVDIEMMFIAFAKTEVENLTKRGRVDSDALLGLWKDGKADVIGLPRTVTRSDQETTMRSAKFCVYPTSYDYKYYTPKQAVPYGDANSGSNVPSKTSGRLVAAVPKNLETRDVGMTVQFVGHITPNSSIIDLSVSAPEIVYEPQWVDFVKGMSSTNKESAVSSEQPFFFINTFSTEVAIEDGERVLVGGGMETPDRMKYVYAFVSATTVDAVGDPIRRKGISERR